MNMKINFLSLIFLVFLEIQNSNATTVVIGFDDAPTGYFLTKNYYEKGFKMTLITGHYDIQDESWNPNGTRFLGLDNTPHLDDEFNPINYYGFSIVEFTSINGNPFNFLSFENIANNLLITSSAGGLMATQRSGIHMLNGTVWQNLNWLKFSSDVGIGGIGIDSLTLTSVPVPAAIWLFISGLLFVVKRKARWEE